MTDPGATETPPRWWRVVLISAYLTLVGLLLLVTFRLPLGERVRAARARRSGKDRDGDRAPEAELSEIRTSEVETPELATPAATKMAAEDEGWFIPLLICPRCGGSLSPASGALQCEAGHDVPVANGIPRFVPSDDYTQSFSLEWLTHDTTQLDSKRGSAVTEATLREKTGLTPADVRDKLVLDAGVGSGRFSEVLARWGARVIGVDLSLAVESASSNLATFSHAAVAQADLRALPFAPSTFDIIVSIGVLHHTPDTHATFDALVPLLKPGGTMSIWVYPDSFPYTMRQPWIPFTSRIPPRMFHDWCRWFVGLSHRHPESFVLKALLEVFPYSRQGLGYDWDVLDTFDGYSPRFHGAHGQQEVFDWFRAAGFSNVAQVPGPWTTAVRGVRESR